MALQTAWLGIVPDTMMKGTSSTESSLTSESAVGTSKRGMS